VCAPIISGTTSNNNAGRRGKKHAGSCARKILYIYAKAEIIVKITKSTRAQEGDGRGKDLNNITMDGIESE
jgi:hypothetical protein